MELALSAICERLEGELVGDGATRINGVSAPEHTQSGHLTLAEDPPHLARALASAASAILVPAATDLQGRPGIRLIEPKRAFAMLLGLFYPEPVTAPGIHKSAVLGEDVRVGAEVAIGAYAVIEDDVVIGRGSRIGAGVYLGHEVSVGEDCTLHPSVTVYRRTQIGDRVSIHGGSVIGGDGFGYLFQEGRHVKVPQVGNVVIEDDVEIGCNVCVDRATVGSTVIRRGTKIDNLVQIGHNNYIGQHVIITGQGGFSGSVTVGDYAVFGGRAGVTDHVTIGEGARIGLCSVVTKSVAPGEAVWGYPARSANNTKHQLAALMRLPAFMRRMAQLLARVASFEQQIAGLEQRVKQLPPTHATP
jgi:UDP-3-O-[3-hydroxymyristoyl] glucosamine N-acyltransferase